MSIVYYFIDFSEANKEAGIVGVLTVTSKDYWDREHTVNDGDGSKDYKALDRALSSIGCFEICESIYELDMTEEELTTKMLLKGYVLQKDSSFTAFMKSFATDSDEYNSDEND